VKKYIIATLLMFLLNGIEIKINIIGENKFLMLFELVTSRKIFFIKW
jgi:hypothetical protein